MGTLSIGLPGGNIFIRLLFWQEQELIGQELTKLDYWGKIEIIINSKNGKQRTRRHDCPTEVIFFIRFQFFIINGLFFLPMAPRCGSTLSVPSELPWQRRCWGRELCRPVGLVWEALAALPDSAANPADRCEWQLLVAVKARLSPTSPLNAHGHFNHVPRDRRGLREAMRDSRGVAAKPETEVITFRLARIMTVKRSSSGRVLTHVGFLKNASSWLSICTTSYHSIFPRLIYHLNDNYFPTTVSSDQIICIINSFMCRPSVFSPVWFTT